jgi:hypothetical protein
MLRFCNLGKYCNQTFTCLFNLNLIIWHFPEMIQAKIAGFTFATNLFVLIEGCNGCILELKVIRKFTKKCTCCRPVYCSKSSQHLNVWSFKNPACKQHFRRKKSVPVVLLNRCFLLWKIIVEKRESSSLPNCYEQTTTRPIT